MMASKITTIFVTAPRGHKWVAEEFNTGHEVRVCCIRLQPRTESRQPQVQPPLQPSLQQDQMMRQE